MKRLLLSTSLTSLALVLAFDTGNPGWKLDADGKIEVKDGNPVYINSSGQEQTVAGDTISRLNAESKQFREAKEAAEKKLKDFEGIDPVKAKDALEKVKKIADKDLIEAGKVEEVKAEITKNFQTQLQEKDNALTEANSKINGMLISGIFNNSDLVQNGIAVPRDMFEATFRSNFKVEDGKIVAYGKDGNRIFSKKNMGEYADPEEALSILVEGHSQKDQILKANAGNGSGNGGGGGARGARNTMKRAEFEKLSPFQQAETSQKVAKGEMQLTD